MKSEADDRPELLPIERVLLSEPQHTLTELAALARMPDDELVARLRAMGLNVPEDEEVAAYRDEDVAMARRARRYRESGIPDREARAAAHVLSGAMARVAEPLRQLFAATYMEPEETDAELARRYGEMAAELLPLVVADLEYLLRHHLLDFIRNDALGFAERASGRLPDAVAVAVAFADIVGFTRLGQEVPEIELTGIAERLAVLSAETVERPARVVKTIGDAVMLVSAEPDALVRSVLALMDAVAAADGMPPLRAGIAYGRAVSRLGDWYGGTVNLAARMCARARPESVLATNALRDALDEAAGGYSWSEAGFKRIKGFDDPVPALRLRRVPESDLTATPDG